MVCKNPYVREGLAFGCGQCMPCRVRKTREWQNRIILESTQHDQSSFVTLTYDPEKLPADGFLKPAHTRDWLKRIRTRLAPIRLRFYLCGEYGTKTNRPHYHAILFGYPNCSNPRSPTPGKSHFVDGHCCPNCDLLRDTWGHGNIISGTVTPESAGYVAKYVTKFNTSDQPPGWVKPYNRMSLKPGLGYSAMFDIASTLLEYDLEKVLEDVPGVTKHQNATLPLGRYLKKHLRTMIGRDEKTPITVLENYREELRPVQEASYASAPAGSKAFAFKQALIDLNQGKITRMDTYAFNHEQKRKRNRETE